MRKTSITAVAFAVSALMTIGFATTSQAAEKESEPIVTVSATVGIA